MKGIKMQTETTRRSLKEKQRQEREDLILRAAEEVLIEKGYHDTSMDEIAARVGVAKGTVYLHFASKEDLVFALFEREVKTFLHVVEQTISAALPARTRLESIFQWVYRGLLGKRTQLLFTLYSNADMELRSGFVKRKDHLRSTLDRLSALIAALFDEGKAAGEFNPTLPTPVLVTSFFSLLSPGMYQRLIVEKQMSPDELVTHLVHIYFQGIIA